MEALAYLERPAADDPRDRSFFTTDAAPTSATCSASPIFSTRSPTARSDAAGAADPAHLRDATSWLSEALSP